MGNDPGAEGLLGWDILNSTLYTLSPLPGLSLALIKFPPCCLFQSFRVRETQDRQLSTGGEGKEAAGRRGQLHVPEMSPSLLQEPSPAQVVFLTHVAVI